ncbi:hypothetical protein CDCA_CDCA20G4823 [Cyanidium caldarium]|uniref:Uncharacterized protein n=1 Tax=Cyanidium caldarium TaxID=2771 RepID=A0AAV9J2I0_CYACA|nr:hypothetical protein CDCA_CDCA20G4823 [Cyanidium caldarium]
MSTTKRGSHKPPTEDVITLQEARERETAKRLQEHAEDCGLLLSAAPPGAAVDSLRPLPAALGVRDGADVIKPSRAARQKYLVLLPAKFRSVAKSAGNTAADTELLTATASLQDADTANPTLLWRLGEEGRLRFRGTLLFPRNAIFSCKGSSSSAKAKHVRIDDVFEGVIVFSEWEWIGREDENPTDVSLPVPAAVLQRISVDDVAETQPRLPIEQENVSSNGMNASVKGAPAMRTHMPTTRVSAFANGQGGAATSAPPKPHLVPVGALTGHGDLDDLEVADGGESDALEHIKRACNHRGAEQALGTRK